MGVCLSADRGITANSRDIDSIYRTNQGCKQEIVLNG